jgi:hypothetical protein
MSKKPVNYVKNLNVGEFLFRNRIVQNVTKIN